MKNKVLTEEINSIRKMMVTLNESDMNSESSDVYALHIYGKWHDINEKAIDGGFDDYDEEYEFGPDDYDKLIEMLPVDSKYSVKHEKRYFDMDVSKNGPMKLRIKRGGQEPNLVSNTNSDERDLNSAILKAMAKNPEALKVVIDLILDSED